jgi:hypothetical protein
MKISIITANCITSQQKYQSSKCAYFNSTTYRGCGANSTAYYKKACGVLLLDIGGKSNHQHTDDKQQSHSLGVIDLIHEAVGWYRTLGDRCCGCAIPRPSIIKGRDTLYQHFPRALLRGPTTIQHRSRWPLTETQQDKSPAIRDSIDPIQK